MRGEKKTTIASGNNIATQQQMRMYTINQTRLIFQSTPNSGPTLNARHSMSACDLDLQLNMHREHNFCSTITRFLTTLLLRPTRGK
jgi:hypothetical protein